MTAASRSEMCTEDAVKKLDGPDEKTLCQSSDIQYLLHEKLQPKKYGNGFPIAMFAFGMSNILLGQRSIRALPPDAIAIGQGFWYAGVGQSLCGFFAFCNRDTVGTFMCIIFGSWWYCLAGTNLFPVLLLADEGDGKANLTYNLDWALFLLLNCGVVASGMPKDVLSLFTMMAVTITGTFAGIFTYDPSLVWAIRLSGVACTASGVSASYIAASHFLREIYGRDLLPLGFFHREGQQEDKQALELV